MSNDERTAPEGLMDVSTRLTYRDVGAAVEYLGRVFGFEEVPSHRVDGPQGRIITTAVRIGEAYVWLGGAGAHGLQSPADVDGPTSSLMVYVKGIDDHFAVAEREGATIIKAPEDMYWGDRRYEALDLDGHHWFLHERTRHIPAEEIAEIEASFGKP